MDLWPEGAHSAGKCRPKPNLASRSTKHHEVNNLLFFSSTIMNEQSQERLIELLRARNLPIDHEAISAAFSDPQSQLEVQNWMRECLGPETLLTLDEVAL